MQDRAMQDIVSVGHRMIDNRLKKCSEDVYETDQETWHFPTVWAMGM